MKLPDFRKKKSDTEARKKKKLLKTIGNVAHHKGAGVRERNQLNLKVDIRLKGYLQRLALKFSVPRDIVAEHVLEKGIFYTERILDNENAYNILRRHLIDNHQLSNKIIDNESILRMGEAGNISKLLDHVELVLQSWHAYQRVVLTAQRTGNISHIERYEKQLRVAVVGLAMWLDQNPVDEPGQPGD